VPENGGKPPVFVMTPYRKNEKEVSYMKYAKGINDILKAFNPEPLNEDSIKDFYYDGTMKSRVGDDYVSPINDIFESCITTPKSAYLLLGHRGCGKSTELNMLKKSLREKGFPVENINCSLEIDMMSPAVWDLLLLITEKLLIIANEINCEIDRHILNSLINFFEDIEEIRESVREANAGLEAGVEAGLPVAMKPIPVINFFIKAKGEVKYGETTRTIIREVVEKRAPVWISYVNIIADKIADKRDGKRPVLFVEDVDKIDPGPVKDLFYKYAKTLSEMSFHIIYTFPISLSYHPDFTSIQGRFSCTTLPIIKVKCPDNSRYKEGIEAIRTIISKRAELGLFAEGVLDLIIEKTGGSLRDLFMVIINAGKRARNRNKNTIEFEDAGRALSELKSDLTRRIDGDDYPFLINLLKPENKTQIEKKEHLLKMMQALVVLEYHNGERWQDVHPLVTDFLKENVMNGQRIN
jgi:energy-coupling factor transporter ATP-binding protein EcfA2